MEKNLIRINNGQGGRIMRWVLVTGLGLSSMAESEIPLKQSEILWLGTYGGEIRAFEEKIHLAKADGEIVLLKQEGDKVGPHDNWALVNRDRLLMKEKSFALSERNYALSLDDHSKKFTEEKEQLELQLEEIGEEYKRLQKLQEVAGAEEFSKEITEALDEIIEEKQKLEEKFTQRYSPERISFEKDQLHLNMEQQREELANYRDAAYLKAGVKGTIKYLLHKNSYVPDSTDNTAMVATGDPIALIRNDDIVLIYIPEANFDAVLGKDRDYFARVRSESGMVFTAYYYDVFDVVNEGKVETFYRFEISKGDLPVAQKCIGEECVLNMLQRFEKHVTIVEKESLIKEDPDFIKANGWEPAVLKLFPKMKLAGVGKGAIALKPNEKMSAEKEEKEEKEFTSEEKVPQKAGAQ